MIFKVIFIVVLSFFVASQNAWALDRIFLKNGDRLTGDIQNFDTNKAFIKTDYGTYPVPIDQMAGVQSDDAVIQSELSALLNGDQNISSDTRDISAARRNDNDTPVIVPSIAISSTPAPLPAVVEPLAEEVKKPQLKPQLWGADFKGEVALDASLTGGNDDDKEFDADTDISLRWEKHRLNFDGEFEFEQDDGSDTDTAWQADLVHSYFFAEKWFWNNDIGLAADDDEELDLRLRAFTGPGYQVFDRDDLGLKFTAGIGFQREDFATQGVEESVSSLWTSDYKQSFYEDAIRVFHENELTVPFDGVDAFLFESDTGIEAPLVRGIFARTGVDFEWDNDPALGALEEDSELYISLGYEW